MATASVGSNCLLGVVVAGGMGPPDTPEAATDYAELDLQMLGWSREKPGLARMALTTIGFAPRIAPGTASKSFQQELSPRDKELYEAIIRDRTPRESLRFLTEALRGGTAGLIADYAALSADWGFPIQDIITPVHVRQGGDDRMVPPVHAHNLASRLSACNLIERQGEGHMLVLNHSEEMLRQAAALE